MGLRKRVAVVAAISLASVASSSLTAGSLTSNERAALVVLIVAAGLWMTEAVPLAATALLIPVMQSVLGVQGFGAALAPFFDTVVMLLLGGFLLAVAVEKYDLDEYFAYQILSRVRARPSVVVLVIMGTAAFLSMWISNTAATALLITMGLNVCEGVEDEKRNFAKVMVLAIAYSATVGGLSTLIGTTTCAMAAGFLRDTIGYQISFLGWTFYGLPLTLIMILVIWAVLFSIFPTSVKSIPAVGFEERKLDRKQRGTLIVFLAAVLLWITEKLPEPIAIAVGWPGHGLSSSVVAAIIAVALFFTGLLDERDLPRANWGTLLLIGGGLSLGSALEVSGLVVKISSLLLLFTGGASGLVTIALVVAFGLGISIIASNTASAGIFLPIALGLASSTGVNPVILAVAVGMSTSLDFMLPVGTPPNAIAYSTGRVSMGEMIRAGVLLDVLGALTTIILAWLVWPRLI